ncbi:MAG: DUF1127 domain-containing protein [Pseudomonadota bacterium]
MSANATMVNDHSLSAAASVHGVGGSSKHGSVFGQWFRAIGTFARDMARQHKARSTAAQLTRLDDAILKDIGISRGEILGLADELASGKSDGVRPIRFRSDSYRPVGE